MVGQTLGFEGISQWVGVWFEQWPPHCKKWITIEEGFFEEMELRVLALELDSVLPLLGVYTGNLFNLSMLQETRLYIGDDDTFFMGLFLIEERYSLT